jgi:acetyl-CoA carboxylase alpha subunit
MRRLYLGFLIKLENNIYFIFYFNMDSYSWWSNGSKYISRTEMNKIKKKMLKSFKIADQLIKEWEEIQEKESCDAEKILSKQLEDI